MHNCNLENGDVGNEHSNTHTTRNTHLVEVGIGDEQYIEHRTDAREHQHTLTLCKHKETNARNTTDGTQLCGQHRKSEHTQEQVGIGDVHNEHRKHTRMAIVNAPSKHGSRDL